MKTPPQRSSELLHARGRQLLRAFTDRRPSGNGLGYCWSQARLSLRIPKTQPTSLPVAWEISAIVRRKLPRTQEFRDRLFPEREEVLISCAGFDSAFLHRVS